MVTTTKIRSLSEICQHLHYVNTTENVLHGREQAKCIFVKTSL